MNTILQKANLWIKFPSSIEEIREAQRLGQQVYSFPSAIGDMDCTHVRIPKPSEFGDEYINRKGFASIDVQATCDAQDKFTSVDVQWPGSTHESRIWKRSNICAVLRCNTQRALLLADEGYGIEPCLMTPYQNPNTPEETRYNNLLKKERVCIERCFGQLKQRFSILQYKARLKLENIPKLIVCCVVLHNIAKTLCDPDFDLEELQPNDVNNYIEGNENDDIRRSGMRRREKVLLSILFFNKICKVS
ncbi:putative nuclease HARBI1 [Sitophilus oryzae]|uniref:Nuclease HARBI1 n=1 Tax=Sitophilus oryzae TaxID=7048 RepID=A0A6J2YE49_SITOR|nr:putative nuclease HARBI1 [Sitophilus oryzae]